MAFLDLVSAMGGPLPSLFSSPAFGQDPGDATSAYASADVPAGPFDRFGAGLLGFANSSAPVPALGNLIGGLITGQRTDPAGMLQRQPGSGSAPDTTSPGTAGLFDRLDAGLMGFANSRAPVAAVGNLLGGLITGQRTDPAGIMQRLLQQRQQAVPPDQPAGTAPDQGRGQAAPFVPPFVRPIMPSPVRTAPPAATFNDRFDAVFPGAAARTPIPPLAAISALRAYPGLREDFIARYGSPRWTR